MSIKALATAVALALLSPAVAAQSAGSFVWHNGSLMQVNRFPGQLIEIRYIRPRPGLWDVGVRPGTLLLRGQWNGPVLTADAFVFSWQCGPTPYSVSGGVDASNTLVLQGLAPILDPYSCGVLGVAPTYNSTLVFTPAVAP